MAGNVGATMIQRLALKIESSCESGLVEAIPALLTSLNAAFKQFDEVIGK